MKKNKQGYLGKYREIIFAVALFVVLDLSVLILNFYTSYEISDDALSINLAGRQRMLSQRITKSLLIAESNAKQNLPLDEALEELKKTTTLFDKTLNAFELGGNIQGGDGKGVTLNAISLTAGVDYINQAKKIWNPFIHKINQLTQEKDASIIPSRIEDAVRFGLDNNLQLLALMNKLTTTLEESANAKADKLRTIQTIGIMLALINFSFILFKFIRRLRENDRQIEIAQNETGEILATVKEGLFLLDSQFRIGSQFSASLEKMLGIPVITGADFKGMMRTILPAKIFTNATDYIDLLFSEHVKEGLLGDLNPLNKVEVNLRNKHGESERRYLTFSFNKVRDSGKTLHLLVTLFDVTNEVELEFALSDAKEEAKLEMDGLLSLLKIDPVLLKNFISQAELNLIEINEELRSADGNNNFRPLEYRRTVDAVFRKVHAFKGDTAMLGLEIFEGLAQNFETQLSNLRSKTSISGEDLLILPFYLEEILQRIAMVKDLMMRLSSYHDAFNPAIESESFVDNLERLMTRIANDHGKKVKLVSDLRLLTDLPQNIRKELKEIAVQLLRNAIAHGIEPVDERVKKGKQPSGNIHIALHTTPEGAYEFSMLDDGHGLVPEHIKRELLRKGKYSMAQLAEFSDKQILMKIFEPGFTTATKADRHSGHGVGLDVVQQKIEQIGAKLRISTRENMFTQFSILFPA